MTCRTHAMRHEPLEYDPSATASLLCVCLLQHGSPTTLSHETTDALGQRRKFRVTFRPTKRYSFVEIIHNLCFPVNDADQTKKSQLQLFDVITNQAIYQQSVLFVFNGDCDF